MANYVSLTSDKSKWVAFWLCLVLGYFGAHYFYVGRGKRGLIALCTLNFFMVGWFVDIFKILFGAFRDNVGMPLRS